jgi:hypothetical protein
LLATGGLALLIFCLIFTTWVHPLAMWEEDVVVGGGIVKRFEFVKIAPEQN